MKVTIASLVVNSMSVGSNAVSAVNAVMYGKQPIVAVVCLIFVGLCAYFVGRACADISEACA